MPDSSPRANTPAGRLRLGEILVAGGAVTAEQLERALAEQPRLQLPLGQTLLHLGYTTDEVMRQALSSQLGVPYIDLQNVIIDRSLADLLDRDFARQHALFPVARIGKTLTIAMDDPTQTAVVEELAATTQHAVTVVTSSHDAIQRSLVRLYEKAGKGPHAPAARSWRAEAMPEGPFAFASLLGLEPAELPDLLRAIEQGLPFTAFDHFVQESGLSEARAAAFADIAEDTLVARRGLGRFARDESDRLARAARVFAATMPLFNGDRSTTSAWLLSSQPMLGGAVPLRLARTELGAREVERALASLTSRSS
ncbi:MAG: antitoxin Xre-like helix-turn-helix domain-containing protein [Acidobacteriota bacterium]